MQMSRGGGGGGGRMWEWLPICCHAKDVVDANAWV